MRVLLLIACLAAAVPAFARGDAATKPTDRGPAVGAAIPSDLSSTDQYGKPRNFDNLKGPRGLVLVFFRSAKWCPYCKRQLIDINGGADAITARGYGLAALSYDPVKVLRRYGDDHHIGYTLLSDPDSKVIDAFGIRNEGYKNVPFAYGVPYPMIFIIAPDGTVQAKLAEEGYKKRPPVGAVIEAIDALDKDEP